MSLKRTIARGVIAKENGSKAVKPMWRDMQIKRYGWARWRVLFILCDPKGRHAGALEHKIAQVKKA